MLLRWFGMDPEKSNRGSPRRRSSTQFAAIRLELLEERFLLSGTPAQGLSALHYGPILTSPAEIDSSPPAPGPVSSAGQPASAPETGEGAQGDDPKANAPLKPGAQQQAATASSNEQAQNQNVSADAFAAGSNGQSGSSAAGSGSAGAPVTQPCSVGSGGSASSQGAVSATNSQASSPSFPGLQSSQTPTSSLPTGAPFQPSSVSLPLPMPSGIPVGGIFTQIAAHGNHASVSVLSVDAVAIDFSSLNSAPVTPIVAPAAGQPAALITQAAGSAPGPGGVLRGSLRLSSNSTPRLKPLEITKRPARERAQLPEVVALESSGIPNNGPVFEMVQSAIPTTKPEALLVSQELPAVDIGIDPGETGTGGQTDRDEQRASADVIVYSAGWVTVAVSAPGLTSMTRRGRRRVRRRPTLLPKGRSPGSAR
jgi:hypothetical protein